MRSVPVGKPPELDILDCGLLSEDGEFRRSAQEIRETLLLTNIMPGEWFVALMMWRYVVTGTVCVITFIQKKTLLSLDEWK